MNPLQMWIYFLKIHFFRYTTGSGCASVCKSAEFFDQIGKDSFRYNSTVGSSLSGRRLLIVFVKPVLVKALLAGIILCLSFDNTAASVKDSVRTRIENDIEDLLEHFESENNTTEMESAVNLLEEMAANPVNINRATVDMLAGIPSLSLRLAREIVSYRNDVRPFEKTSDLLEVRGIGAVTLERVEPYVTVGSVSELKRDLFLNRNFWLADGRLEIISRLQRVLQTREGYTRTVDEGGYAGSQYRVYQRFRYRSDHLSINLTQEKDPGETLEGPTGFDFNSWHLEANNLGNLRTLVIGDYNLQFGQGLVMWRSSSFGKSLQTTGTSVRNESGVRPYTSSQETNFFRGVALSYGGRIQTSLFYSKRNLSASPVSDITIRFPSSTGYHRTATEISRRFNTGQRTAGGRVRAELPIGFIGISGYHAMFEKPVERGNQPWQIHDFQGKNASAFSIDFRFLAGSTTLFGEAARSRNGAFGFISGAEIDVHARTDLVLVYRNYDKRFQSIFGSAFGEQSGMPQNEYGLYLTLQHDISSQWSLRAYIDGYHFPSPRYLMENPSGGYDLAFLVEYSPSRQTEFYLQLRRDSADDEYEAENIYGQMEQLTGRNQKLNVRLHSQYFAGRSVRLRSRMEWVRSREVENSNETGWLFYQDIRLTPTDKLTIDARYTWFSTDGYNSRIYSFENDLLHVFSNNALFDNGNSLYLLAGWRPSESVQFWFKISTVRYLNRDTIGSGRSTINGNRQSRFGLQMRVTL